MATELEEHAEASAEKKGLEGEARRRYIGGIFEKIRQAHARATPEQRRRFEEKVTASNRKSAEAHKAREEEEARRKAHPLAGYWYDPKTAERQKLRLEQKAAERKAKQQEQAALIPERTEEKRTREAYSRLLAKYHNPKLQEERAAALQEYEQLEQQRRKAHYSHFGRGKGTEEERIEKQKKALDAKYGFEEEYKHQQAIAAAAAEARRRQEEAERQDREAARQAQELREHQAHIARRDQVLKERDSWRALSEAEVQRKEKALAEEWNTASKEREKLRSEGKTTTPEYANVERRYDLARLRYQFIDSVLAEKTRPARQAEQEKAYHEEYLAHLQSGRTGKKPKEGYLVDFDRARQIRGEALTAHNKAQKATPETPKAQKAPAIPPDDTRAKVQGDYNHLWQKLNEREQRYANFYLEKMLGRQPAERTLEDMEIPKARREMILREVENLGERSKALLAHS